MQVFRSTSTFETNRALLGCMLLMSLTMSSCMITTYEPVFDSYTNVNHTNGARQPLPINIKRALDKEHRVQPAGDLVLLSSDWEYEVLLKTLKNSSVFTPIINDPYTGQSQRFVNITLRYNYGDSYSHQGGCEVSWMTGGVIPCYGNLSVYEITYEVYVKNTLAKRYKYHYTQTGAYWIGLLPFIWLNAFTSSHEDALVTTVHRFLTQVTTDGLL